MDIVSTFRRAVRRHGDRTFLSDAGESVTYAEADARSDAVAAAVVARDIDTLTLMAPDSVALWLAIIGAWKAGALPALIDPNTQPNALDYFVEDIGTPVIDLEEFSGLPAAERIERHGPDAPLFLSYTSGTTGPPKGVVLRSAPVTLGAACTADRLGLRCHDVLLVTTPTASSFQLVAALMPAIHVGAAVGLAAGRPLEDIWTTELAAAATVLVAYPLTLADLANVATREQSSLRLAMSGGSPLAPRLKRDYRDRLGIDLIESYGQSELGGFMTLGGRPLPDRLAYVADPRSCDELPAGEVGEVLVLNSFFVEYRNKPERYAEATAGGVLHTGDLAVADADGTITVLGRVHERERAVQRGGFLREAEDAAYEHDAVMHAAVVEMRVDGSIGCFAELLPGCELLTDAQLQRFIADRVPAGIVPARVSIVESLPRTFSGKADRLRLAVGRG